MHFTDLEVPEFDNWQHPIPLQKMISAALKRGFDPRGDVHELKPVIKGDLAKIKREHGYEYTQAQINYKLHEMIRRMHPEEVDFISLDRDNRIYQRHRVKSMFNKGRWDTALYHTIHDDDYELITVHIDDESAEWRVYAVPPSDWIDEDFGLIEARGQDIYGVKRNGPKKPGITEHITTSTRW